MSCLVELGNGKNLRSYDMLALTPLDNVGSIQVELYRDDVYEKQVARIPRYAKHVRWRFTGIDVIAELPVQFSLRHARIGHPPESSRTLEMRFFVHFESATAE